MKKLKKILAAALCLAMLTATAAGCASNTTGESSTGGETSTQEEGKDITLKFLYWADETQTKLMQEACRAYEEENPGITIEEQALPADGTFDTYIQAAREQDNLPDISYMGEGDVQRYYEMGLLADISDILSDGTIPEKLASVTVNNPEGKPIAVGLSNQINVLYYSKSKLDAAGVEYPPTDVNDAWTWDEFVENCKKLTKDANGKTPNDEGFDPNMITDYGMGFNCLREFHLFWGMYSNGGGVVSADGSELLMDDPKSIEGVQKFADLINVDHVCSAATYSWDGGAGAVADGLAAGYAMMINGSWDIANVQGNDDIGVGVLPKMEKAVTMNCGGPLVLYKNDDAEKLAEAKKFYAYLVDPAKCMPLLNSGAWLPNQADWYTDPELVDSWGNDYPDGAKETILSYCTTEGAVVQWPAYYVPGYAKMNTAFENSIDKILGGQISAEEGFAECMPQIKEAFESGTVD